jgi:hypothetical protein
MVPIELSVQKKAFIEQFKCRSAWAALRMQGNPIVDSELAYEMSSNEKEFEKMAEEEWETEAIPRLKSGTPIPMSSFSWHDFTYWMAEHFGHVLTDELLEELRQLVAPEQDESNENKPIF